MQVTIAYGEHGLDVDVPETATVVTSTAGAAIADEQAAIRQALATPLAGPPLHELAQAGRDRGAVVVFPDVTRAMPARRVVPVVLAELERAGLGPDRVTLLSATGTHRANTPAELERMLGPEVTDRYRVLNHDGRDGSSLVFLGTTSQGAPALLNRLYVAAGLRVVTGLIEPHFFAGYSGGPKGVCPGVAGLQTVLYCHDRQRIGHPDATWGSVSRNPVQQLLREVVAMALPSFTLDVTIDQQRRITGVFAGNSYGAHEAGCRFVAGRQEFKLPGQFDIVVTGNGGYPLDQNLYQAVKGLSAAARIVRPGGSILLAAECRDGIPSHGSYGAILAAAPSPAAVLATLHDGSDTVPDQWQAQIQALVQERATVYAYCGGLSAEQVQCAHLLPIDDVSATLRELLERQPGASVAVLPEGPYIVPTLASA